MSPPDAELVIVGGGLAAQRCCERLRREGFAQRILVVCEEETPPYDRPPLSKSVLTDASHDASLGYREHNWYADNDIELLLGIAAEQLDTASRTIVLGHAGGGTRPRSPAGRLRYRRLLVASGSRPRRLPGLEPAEHVHELRTSADARRLRDALRSRGGRLTIVGAGLIGMEVASAARKLGLTVTMVEAAPTPLARALPERLGTWLAGVHRRHGVDVRMRTTVERVEQRAESVRLKLSDGTNVRAETVLVAAGTVPATSWLPGWESSGKPVVTDALGRSAIPGVYAAGDAACFPDPLTGARMLTPHWEAAARQGATVAHAICGTSPPPAGPSSFWSDQHGMRIQMIGCAPRDSAIEIDGAADLQGPFAAWVRSEGRPAGALLVDRPALMAQARRLLRDAATPVAGAEQPRKKEDDDGLSSRDRRVGLPGAR